MTRANREITYIDIENHIDQHGLASLLNKISDLADDRAQHWRRLWQDEEAASGWSKVRNAVDAVIPLLVPNENAKRRVLLEVGNRPNET